MLNKYPSIYYVCARTKERVAQWLFGFSDRIVQPVAAELMVCEMQQMSVSGSDSEWCQIKNKLTHRARFWYEIP